MPIRLHPHGLKIACVGAIRDDVSGILQKEDRSAHAVRAEAPLCL